MQLFDQPFDAKTVQPREAFEPLPAGWYNAKIIESEAKPTKDNNGGYLQLTLEILDGEHKGRKVFDRLNLWNQNTQAVEIAHRQLSAYCHATGVFIVQDSNQLHGIPLKVKLSQRQDPGYDMTNDIKAVKHIQDATPATSAQPASAPSPFAVTVQPASPFGQNPALPAQPAPQAPFATPTAAPVPQPAQPQAAPPWGPPAALPQAQAPFAPTAAPAQPLPQQQASWVPPVQTQAQSAPASGPVPPWRK